ncbi:MAG: YfhO family protein, partial [Oscillospiraceae bacterium]|nr:YfhO family protein [Oscillospiraceae bacterium]
NEVLFKDKLFYYLDEEKFSEDIAKIAEHGLNVTYFREDHIKGNINAAKDGIMFTTISWEPGWTVWVDGVKTEPVELCDALIGVPLTAGDHEIEMKFFPAGLKIGILFSLTGIAAIILIGVLEKNGKDKKKDDTEEKAA